MSYVIDASFIEIVKKLNVHWLLRIMIMRFRNFQKLIKHAFQANELSQCWQSLIWWIRARTRWTCWWGRSCRSSSELSESLIGLRLGIFIEIFSSKTFKILLFYLEKACIIMDNFYLKMFVEMLFYRQDFECMFFLENLWWTSISASNQRRKADPGGNQRRTALSTEEISHAGQQKWNPIFGEEVEYG